MGKAPEDLSLILRTHAETQNNKKLDILPSASNSRAGETGKGIPRIFWPADLAYLVSSRPV